MLCCGSVLNLLIPRPDTGSSWIIRDSIIQWWWHWRSSRCSRGNSFLQSMCPVWSWIVSVSWRIDVIDGKVLDLNKCVWLFSVLGYRIIPNTCPYNRCICTLFSGLAWAMWKRVSFSCSQVTKAFSTKLLKSWLRRRSSRYIFLYNNYCVAMWNVKSLDIKNLVEASRFWQFWIFYYYFWNWLTDFIDHYKLVDRLSQVITHFHFVVLLKRNKVFH